MINLSREIYKKNLEKLQKRYPYIENKLTLPDNADLDVQVVDSKDGNKTMSVSLVNKKIHLNSKYRPLEEAKKWADSLELKNNSIVIMFGFGLGYRVKELLKRITKHNKVIIIEPSINIFKETIKNTDISDVLQNENIFILVGGTQEECKNLLWDTIKWKEVDRLIITSIPNYINIFSQEYKTFLNIIKDLTYQRVIDRNTTLHFAQRWQINLLKNIPHILKSSYVKELTNLFENKPAIIVSAGPSLNKNINLLKEVKEKALIICVGTALKAMLKKDIKPDLIISVDGGEPNYYHFKGINYSDIPLVYSPKIYPGILNEHKGEKILFVTDDIYVYNLFKKFNKDIGWLKAGGSVATCAFSLANLLGTNPIVFVGQDLAYTDGKTHAAGTVNENRRVSLNDRKKDYMFVKDINGNDILTDSSLYTFLKWFEKEIENDKSGRIYIDATEGGAKIEGTKIMTFREVINMYCKENINVSEKLKKFLESSTKLSDDEVKNILDEYKNTVKEFNRIKKMCSKGRDLSQELYKIYEKNQWNKTKEIRRIIKKLDEIDEYIKKKKEQFNLIKDILEPIIYNIENMIKEEYESEREKGMKIAEKSIYLYQGLKNAIEYVLPIIEDCIINIEESYSEICGNL